MKTDELIKRRRAQFRFKTLAGIIPLLFIAFIGWGAGALFDDLLGIQANGPMWDLFVFIAILLLLIFYFVGFFAGSLRLDGNVISILSRMDVAEQKALNAVLEEITAQEEKDRKNGSK